MLNESQYSVDLQSIATFMIFFKEFQLAVGLLLLISRRSY